MSIGNVDICGDSISVAVFNAFDFLYHISPRSQFSSVTYVAYGFNNTMNN